MSLTSTTRQSQTSVRRSSSRRSLAQPVAPSLQLRSAAPAEIQPTDDNGIGTTNLAHQSAEERGLAPFTSKQHISVCRGERVNDILFEPINCYSSAREFERQLFIADNSAQTSKTICSWENHFSCLPERYDPIDSVVPNQAFIEKNASRDWPRLVAYK